MVDAIIVQLTQGIARPSLNVTLNVRLFYKGVQFFEDFTLCDLDNFDVILENKFLDAYKINIFHKKGKLRVCAKIGSKLMNLNIDYNFALIEMGVTLVVLASELELFSFMVLMVFRVSLGESKPQGAKQPFTCNLDSLNKFLEVLTDELSNALPPYKKVDHKIKVVLGITMLSKTHYRLN